MPTNDDDLLLLDEDAEFSSPLDRLETTDETPEVPPPDPEEMLALLQSPIAQERTIAARAFCEISEPKAIPHLIALLRDRCPLVRVSAAYALGRNPSPQAIEPIIDQLQKDWNGYVRKGLVWAMGNNRDGRCLQPLLDSLRNDIPAVRLWAASSLAQMAQVGYEAVIGSIPSLIQALRRDPVSAIRSNCAWSLGQLARELPSNVVYAGAIDGLIESFVEDPDLGVREDARSALLKVGDPRALQLIEELEQEGWF
ncbi:HEAT repeat domain-containing protein [Roseofilum casamattae]|uniref:HEAT repeat domain-containing protein n=1 Tax=Roseofilum casamattae BLCC-M143 TaxID=3022442 RepID=A0ABT7C0M8_9CYAN|nr:HEAT repeat domain-containing protein [Roseofilum casamattae]MDJ1185009.1 HEAT repeat domain-containing protein [Roseofilum casamattae BLCC-M143]